MRGRKTLPDGYKEMVGTARPSRKKNNIVDVVKTENKNIVLAPDTLSKKGQSEWTRLMATMSQVEGWILPTDLSALHEHCEAYETLLSAKTELKKHGRVDKKLGRPTAYWRVYKDANEMYSKSCANFGCTPSSRSGLRLGLGDTKEKDDFQDIKT
jgi:P27 family predicted phage terminase small subunit